MRITLGVVAALWSITTIAAPMVEPGQAVSFDQAEGGAVNCRILNTEQDCASGSPWSNAEFGPTTVDPASNRVVAVVDPTEALEITSRYYATSSIYNDFELAPQPGSEGFVDVQISVSWEYLAQLIGNAAYDASVNLVLKVADVTDGAPGALVTAQTLHAQDRSGDQGFGDDESGAEAALLFSESSHVGLKLRTGRTYRIMFEVRSAAVALLSGEPGAMADAYWTNLVVSVDEDTYDRLVEHDEDISESIDDHDTAISDQVGEHDTDIKTILAEIDDDIMEALEELKAGQEELKAGQAELKAGQAELKAGQAELKAGQAEIVRLLLTPQGRRESDQGSFPLKPSNASANQGQSNTPKPSAPPPSETAVEPTPPVKPAQGGWAWGLGNLMGLF
jgi:hypothetical protein